MNEILQPLVIEFMSRESEEEFYLIRFYGKLSKKLYRSYYTRDEFIKYNNIELLDSLIREYKERKKETK